MSTVHRIGSVEIHDEGAGPDTILMVHGWPDTYRLWDAQVEGLKDRYRCLRFTLPAFAEGSARRAHTLDEIAALLREIVETLVPSRQVILMLHDWGCFFGYQFAARHPELVARIVGVDIGESSTLLRSYGLREKALVVGYQGWLALAWTLGGRLGDAMTRRMAKWLGCPTPPATIGARMNWPYYMFWTGGERSFRRQFRRFAPHCPLLFVYGRRKPLMFHAPAWLTKLEQDPRHRVEAFDTGHWVMIQKPQRFNAVVREWLGAPVAAAATG